MHGSMHYMQKHGQDRLNANIILPGTVRIVSIRVPYVPLATTPTHIASTIQNHMVKTMADATNTLKAGEMPYISLYARGRDYHKTLRKRLQKLMDAVHAHWGPFGYRITCDSAPTPEVEIARKAGLGWRGKHTLLIHPQAGSLFFLAEVFTNLPLPLSKEFSQKHCGSCTQCISACPTQAIVTPSQVDARLCISYLTIENPGPIPLTLRPLMGTRLYGCDDCQLACPWNKFAQPSTWADFDARPQFNSPSWANLMAWSETDFLKHTEGSAIRRIGFERWQRNLAVAAGNALAKAHGNLYTSLRQSLAHMAQSSTSTLVREHAHWGLAQQPQQNKPIKN